jgi:hypothetical protein
MGHDYVCKVSLYEHAWSFENKYIKLRFIGIFYEAILHKMEFGQAYKDLLNRILMKFILYFSKFYCIF